MGWLTAWGVAWCAGLGIGALIGIGLVAYVASPEKLPGADLAVVAGWEAHLVERNVKERNPQRVQADGWPWRW